MDAWQKRYEGLAAFVCVSCAGPELAVAFSQRLKLERTTVAVAEDGPFWGQLGCNGFIVLDKDLNVVRPATSAFLEVRDLAFQHVETVLDAVIAGNPPPRVCPGMKVVLTGLSSAEHNGKSGMCVGQAQGEDKRVPVELTSGKTFSVKDVNLVLLSDIEEDSCCGGGSCEGGNCSLPEKEKSQPANCEGGNCALPVSNSNMQPETDPDGRMALSLGHIDSVKVAVLDEEHDQCASALTDLAKYKTKVSLEAVLKVYELHFTHEEELLDTHIYGDVVASHTTKKLKASGFDVAGNQRKSHYADHQRMIQSILARLKQDGDSIDNNFINQVLNDFETHANTYDSSYAEPLSAKLDR